MVKDKALYIRVTEEEKALLEVEAKKVSRSLCNYIMYAVKSYIKIVRGDDNAN